MVRWLICIEVELRTIVDFYGASFPEVRRQQNTEEPQS